MKNYLIGILSITIGYTIILGGIGFLITFLWNLMMPGLFNAPEINILEALTLYALCRLFAYDWIPLFNKYLLAAQREKQEVTKDFIEQ
jgi:hypothetical protein